MKRQKNSIAYLLVFAVLLFSCSEREKKSNFKKAGVATIILKDIKNVDSLYVGSKYIDVEKPSMTLTIPDSMEIFTVTFNNKKPETRTFRYHLNDDEFMSATLNITRDEYTAFLEPGDTVKISIDDKGNVEKALYNEKENHPALIYVTQKFPNFIAGYMSEMFKDSANFNPEEFSKTYVSQVNDLIKEKQELAKQELSKKNITENIAFAIKTHGNYISDAMAQKRAYKVNWNDKAMGLLLYRNLPTAYLFDKNEGAGNNNMKALLNKNYDEIINDKEIPKKTKILLLKTLIELMGKSAPDLVLPSIAKIPDETIRTKYKKYYSEKFMLNLNDFKLDTDKINLVAYNKTSSENIFTYKNLLEKHKGKIVYIDFWASWCKPCRAEMPASHQLREELKNEPIEFVYLSVDDSYNNWAAAVVEEKITENPNSLLILNSKNSTLYKSWNIMGIPRFMILDKNGEIVESNATKPSDSKTKKILLNLAKM